MTKAKKKATVTTMLKGKFAEEYQLIRLIYFSVI